MEIYNEIGYDLLGTKRKTDYCLESLPWVEYRFIIGTCLDSFLTIFLLEIKFINYIHARLTMSSLQNGG